MIDLKEEFNFYGVGLRLIAADSVKNNIFLKLKNDFLFAIQTLNQEPDITIVLESPYSPYKDQRKGIPVFKTSICQVYGVGRHRLCDYGEGTQVHGENKKYKRSFKIFSKNDEHLYEVAYTLILSSVGESLDLKGYHRVHGLGFSFRNLTYLLILPSGGGKSSLATILRHREGVKFFSDETPLVKKGIMYPFPLRVSIRPEVADTLGIDIRDKQVFKRKCYPEKILIPWQNSEVAGPCKIDRILVGKVIGQNKNRRPQISPVNQAVVLAGLTHSMVVGLGVAQMAEHMLRLNSLGSLSRIGLSRAKEALSSTLNAKSFSFHVGANAFENAVVLNDFINSTF